MTSPWSSGRFQDPSRRCGAVGCLCPRCGRECLLARHYHQPTTSVRAWSTWSRSAGTGARRGTLDGLRLFRPRSARRTTEAVDSASGATRPCAGDGRRGAAARAHRMLTETAARRAGYTHWAPETENLVGDLVKAWGTEIAVLARAYHLHETSHREQRKIFLHVSRDEVDPREVSVAALSGPLTFASVARAVATLLERTKQRFPVLYVRPFDGSADARTALRAAFPYAEPLLGPNEMGAVVQLLEEFQGPGDVAYDAQARLEATVTFDAEANELISRVFAHRLAWLCHRARPVSPVFDLPGGASPGAGCAFAPCRLTVSPPSRALRLAGPDLGAVVKKSLTSSPRARRAARLVRRHRHRRRRPGRPGTHWPGTWPCDMGSLPQHWGGGRRAAGRRRRRRRPLAMMSPGMIFQCCSTPDDVRPSQLLGDWPHLPRGTQFFHKARLRFFCGVHL